MRKLEILSNYEILKNNLNKKKKKNQVTTVEQLQQLNWNKEKALYVTRQYYLNATQYWHLLIIFLKV